MARPAGSTLSPAAAPPNVASPTLAGRLTYGACVLFGALPLRLRQMIGRGAGALYSLFPSRERMTAETQISAFLPEEQTARVVRGVFMSVGQTVAEAFNLAPFLTGGKLHLHCENEELVNEVLRSGRPTLGLTAHTGNWELFAAYLIRRGAPLVAIGRPARSPAMNFALQKLRAVAGIPIIWRGGREGIRLIRQAFDEGKIVGALVDQDTRVNSIPVPFFGRLAQTPATIIEIAKKHDALMVTGFVVRTGINSYSLYAGRLDEKGSTEEILTAYHHQLEAVLRRHPDQWVWFHKRWRTTPSGERLSSREYLESFGRRPV